MEALERSDDMVPVEGTVSVHVPADVLWECFRRADWWPRWNRCFYWARNTDLVPGQPLVWCFQPIRPEYVYKLPAMAGIVEVEPRRRVTWHVTALPGFFARHTYLFEELEDGSSRFGSWEKAMGPSFRATRRFWLSHFKFVCDRSMEGARRLEAIYAEHGRLDDSTLPPRPRW